jgi:hypothetical protein
MKATNPPSVPNVSDLGSAIAVLRDVSEGHCSWGTVSLDMAAALRRVADWLEKNTNA